MRETGIDTGACGRALRVFAFALSGILSAGSAVWAADPVLYFTDIVSGPRTGNSDSSGGRTPGQNGAIVTVWGVNLGETRGHSKIYCNGVEAASYYSWGNATAPADLYTYHRMQMVSFQISGQAADGNGQIYAMVNGRRSNSLKFTVRAGGIFFVLTNGNDGSGDGSYAHPWRTIPAAVRALTPGDTLYVGNGVNQTTETDYSACVDLGTSGEKGKPIALIVYPVATSKVGNTAIERAFFDYAFEVDDYTRYWVVSKFTITTGTIGVEAREGCRVVGNFITAPKGDGMDGAINVEGKDSFILGNELKNVGTSSCSKLYHGIYGKGWRKDEPPRAPTESNREIAWNYIHDNLCDRAINIYSEQANSAFITKHRIHDNVIINQRGDGIMLGYYVVGKNWIYNNLVLRAGLGPAFVDEDSYHVGIRINSGHENVPRTDVYCYNNTVYECGWSGAYEGSTGQILVSPEAIDTGTIADFRYNIVYSTKEPYLAGESVSLPKAAYRNCWFGRGSAPSWDTNAVNSNPLFVNGAANDVRLQATSPCVNAGQKIAPVSRDLLGTVRPQGTGTDLGAYEYLAAASGERDGLR